VFLEGRVDQVTDELDEPVNAASDGESLNEGIEQLLRAPGMAWFRRQDDSHNPEIILSLNVTKGMSLDTAWVWTPTDDGIRLRKATHKEIRDAIRYGELD
jgi:hypothetical protein